MINKISNLKLILGLVILVLIYLAVEFFDSSKSVQLEKQLVSVDTSMVTQIVIQNPNEAVKLTRTGGNWQVDLPSGKKVSAVPSKVQDLLSELLHIKADRLAAKEKEKWAEYKVDSLGTKLRVHQGDQMTLDMVVGQLGNTGYIRLANETEVYTSDNFKGLSAKERINHYRDNTFVKMATDSIISLSFNYPGDSSFNLLLDQPQWMIDESTEADSSKTSDYLQNLSLKFNDNFAKQDGSSVGPKIAEIVITSKNQQQVFITAFQDPADSVIFQSSVNSEAYFE